MVSVRPTYDVGTRRRSRTDDPGTQKLLDRWTRYDTYKDP